MSSELIDIFSTDLIDAVIDQFKILNNCLNHKLSTKPIFSAPSLNNTISIITDPPGKNKKKILQFPNLK